MIATQPIESKRVLINLALATPLILVVPVGFGLLLTLWDTELNWAALGFGAAGWAIALVLRSPVALVAGRVSDSPHAVQRSVMFSSGPLEETARLIVVILVGREFGVAFSIGLGWAAAEVVYSLVNGYVMASLNLRTDEKAAQARQQLQELGLPSQVSPFWGILERVSASALHIGFTLLLAMWPLLLLATIPVHSATNAGVMAVLRESVLRAQGVVAVVGLALFLVGLAAFGKI